VRELPPISLDGFAPSWGDFEHTWGPPVLHDGEPWQANQYHCEILGRYDHDYLGAHLYVQVWDYAQQGEPDQRWQYLLLLHRPKRYVDDADLIVGTGWDWVIRNEWPVAKFGRPPTFAEVGADVDLWLQCPEVLRFIIE
jgi:hypothetical protein